MTIVTYIHRPKRRPKLAQAAEIKMPRIVQHTPKGRAWELAAIAAARMQKLGLA